jgi:predicted amidohydrolase
MRDVKVSAVQFEAHDRDKEHNLGAVRGLAQQAAERGAELVAFHECCITGYSFLQDLSLAEMLELAEAVPSGPSTRALQELARSVGVAIGAGLLERSTGADGEPLVHNTYVVVDASGQFVAKHRKLHTFVSPHLTPGDGFCVFELLGCRWGILICYDNNLAENARCTAMAGAEIILAPHVTGGTASNQPGRGKIDAARWVARESDPVPLRAEFRSLKGREWVLRFLPCRAWENGVYYVFANNVGRDHDTIKPGGAMLLDACGNVLDECTELGDGLAVALLTEQGARCSSGARYIAARRPELYSQLVEPNPNGITRPAWQRSLEAQDGAAREGGTFAR